MIERDKIPVEIMNILEEIQNNGYSAFLVGGCVRDLVLFQEPKDYDITTSAKPEEVKSLFTKVIDTGLKHGTVTVLRGMAKVEITTYRTSQQYKNIEEDVRKRDFTINALLFDGQRLIDYVDGLKDIKRRTIRAVGDPADRFAEDPLRMIRAVRLSSQLGFTVEENTLDAIKEMAYKVKESAQERIRDELVKILLSRSPGEGIRLLQDTGLLQQFLPELSLCYGFEQHNPYHCKDVFEHTMAVIEGVPAKLTVRLAALLHDIGKPETFSLDEEGKGHFYGHDLSGSKLAREILKRLNFENKTINSVSKLVGEHMNRKIKKHISLKRLIVRVGQENLENLFDLQLADELGSKTKPDTSKIMRLREKAREIIQRREPLSRADLAVNGKDLIELGVTEGPAIGATLDKLLEYVLVNPENNSRDKLIIAAQRIQTDFKRRH